MHHNQSWNSSSCLSIVEIFSLMNKPSDSEGAKVNLLCINKLLSRICSFDKLEMEVRKLPHYLYTTETPEHVNKITEMSFLSMQILQGVAEGRLS